ISRSDIAPAPGISVPRMPLSMILTRAASSGARASFGRVREGPRLPSPLAPWHLPHWASKSFWPRARSALLVGSFSLDSGAAAIARRGHITAKNAGRMVGDYRNTACGAGGLAAGGLAAGATD